MKAKGMTKEQINTVLRVMASHNIKTITVSFDGSGDSGQIESVDFDGGDDGSKDIQVQWAVNEELWNIATGDYVDNFVQKDGKLEDLVSDVVYTLLEDEHGGWELDDGSSGTFTFDAAHKSVEVVFNERYTDYRTKEYTIE